VFSLAHLSELLLQYRYIILFPLAIVEGPLITVIAGFSASLGYLNLWLSYIVIVAGDLVADLLHYAAGRWGRETFIKKYGKYIGIHAERVEGLEKHFGRHGGKTLLIGKASHGVGGMFLVAAGLARMPFWRFFWFNALGTFIKSLVLLGIGYYFGRALGKINSLFDFLALLSVSAFLTAVFIYIYYLRGKKKRSV
jgi:membrane protein DedA with SNARE-associated domain